MNSIDHQHSAALIVRSWCLAVSFLQSPPVRARYGVPNVSSSSEQDFSFSCFRIAFNILLYSTAIYRESIVLNMAGFPSVSYCRVSEKTIIGTIFLHSVGVRRSAICALREAILGIHQNSFKQNHFYDLLMSHVHSLTRQKRPFHAYITTNTNLSIALIVELIVMSLIVWLQTPQLTHLTLAKWPPVRRRRFQMHFLEWKCMNFDLNFIEVCS